MNHPISRPRLVRRTDAEFLKEAAGAMEAVQLATGKTLPWLARQLHTMTGWFPGLSKATPEARETFLKSIRSGPHLAGKRLEEATKAYEQARGTPKAMSALKALRRAKSEEKWVGLTGGTIPGTIKAMVGGKAMPTLRAGWGTLPTWAKGLTGYFGYTGAKDVATTPSWMYGQPGFPHKSRAEHLGKELGTNLGFVATGGLPMVPMMLGSMGAEQAMGLPGRLLAPKPQRIPRDLLTQAQAQAELMGG